MNNKKILADLLDKNLTEKEIIIYMDFFDFDIEKDNIEFKFNLSKYQTLSNEFMNKYKSKINWEVASKYQVLNKRNIIILKKEVNWENIKEFQELEEASMRHFKENIDWAKYIEFGHINKNVIKKITAEIGRYGLKNFEKVKDYKKLVQELEDISIKREIIEKVFISNFNGISKINSEKEKEELKDKFEKNLKELNEIENNNINSVISTVFNNDEFGF